MAGNMSFTALWKSGLAAACLLSAVTANATLVPAMGGQVVNDTDLNITWLANANLAATNAFGVGSIGVTGAITLLAAVPWLRARETHSTQAQPERS